jgi:hypothetical protein
MMIVQDGRHLRASQTIDRRRGRLEQQFLYVAGQIGPESEGGSAEQALNFNCAHLQLPANCANLSKP